MIAFPCPKCRATLKAPEEKVGAQTKCRYCGSPVQVPAPPVAALVTDPLPAGAPPAPVAIPLTDVLAVKAPVPPALPVIDLLRERPGVLVADDEPQVLALLEALLKQQDFTVWLAADGHRAVELYREHQAEIGAVLLDVRMPGLDGPGTLAALRQVNPQVRCCFLSGHTGGYDAAFLQDTGAVAFLPKPFRPADLTRVLREILAPAPPPSHSGA
jgi:CheY-like chemotaxis protein